MEPQWGRFVVEKDRAGLSSIDDEVRRKAWWRVYNRKSKAIKQGLVQKRNYRPPESNGFTQMDLEDLSSEDGGRLLMLRRRIEHRYRRLHKKRPPTNTEQWTEWLAGLYEESGRLAQVMAMEEKLRTSTATATPSGPSTRPVHFAGLTNDELIMFRSGNVGQRETLRNRLSSRITSARRKLERGADARVWQPMLLADTVWRASLQLLKTYPADAVEKHVPAAITAAADLPMDKVSEKIPKLLALMVADAKQSRSIPTQGSHSAQQMEQPLKNSASPARNDPAAHASSSQHQMQQHSQLAHEASSQPGSPVSWSDELFDLEFMSPSQTPTQSPPQATSPHALPPGPSHHSIATPSRETQAHESFQIPFDWELPETP